MIFSFTLLGSLIILHLLRGLDHPFPVPTAFLFFGAIALRGHSGIALYTF